MKKFLTVALAAGALVVAACGGTAATPAPAATEAPAAATEAPMASEAPAASVAAAGGLVGIAMPTKSSARWIADGDNLVKAAQGDAATRPTSSTPRTTSRPRSPRSRT